MGKSVIILILSILSITVFGQTKSYSFEVQKTGQGKQTIIFIPGFACSGEVWNETKEIFERDFTCLTLTMAGFAGVEAQPNPSFENWKTSIADYIKDQNIQKPILVGHSMGGGLAMAIAGDYPELVDRIIIVDALPCLQALSNPDFKTKEVNDCSTTVKQMIEISDGQFYQMQKMSIPSLLEDKTMQEKIIDWSVKSDRKVFAEMYCDFWNTDLREKIKAIKCPTLVLLESGFVNLKASIEEQYKNLRTANLQYANKGLHFIMYDDTEWYFTQLTNFIAIK